MDERIASLLAEGLERDLYFAAHQNLNDLNNKLRLNNFAYAMRELVRHVLARLAPDNLVIKSVWYRNETNDQQGVTRRQRARFAVQGGLTDEYVRDILELETDGTHAALIRAINELSKLTHVERAVFGLADANVTAKVQETEEAVALLCSTIEECREQIIHALWLQIDEAVVCETLRETIAAIDEISAHYSIEEVYTDQVEITGIFHNKITFKATGSITTGLQWGSNSDVRRGDGLVGKESFPFTCYMWSPVDDPGELQPDEDGLLVDTSSWADDYYGERE